MGDYRKKIKVLIIEDSADDGLLLIRHLRKNDYDPEFLIVDSEPTIRKALLEEDWEIVISDYSLNGFTGIDALKILNEVGKDIPFIMVSGMMGEEMAVQAMKNGAQDYLMKGHMDRLVPAIEREMADATNRRKNREEEAAHDKTRKRFELLVDYSPIGILIINKSGEFIYVNPKAIDIFGYEKEEYDMVENLFARLYPEKEISATALEVWNKFITVPVNDLDIIAPPILTKKHEKKYVRIIATVMDDENIMVLAEDITVQHQSIKELEKNQRRLGQIIDTIEDSIIELNINKTGFEILSANNAFYQQTKYSKEEVIGKSIDRVFPTPKKWIRTIKTSIAEKSTIKWEQEFNFPGGEVIWEVYISPLFDKKNKLWRIIISANNITERKRFEKKILEDEKRFRTIATLVSDCIWEWTVKTNELWWNEGIKTFFGYDEHDIENNIQWIIKKAHPNDKDKINKGIINLIKERKKSWNIDFQFMCKDGTYKNVNTKAIILYNNEKIPYKITAAMIDMTHRKKMEDLRIQSLVEGADNERKIIASELHDDLAQNLMLTNLHLQEYLGDHTADAEMQPLVETKNLVSKILEDTRRMSHSLMPRTLEDFGIIPAVQNIIDNIRKGVKIEISTYFNFENDRFDPQFEINVYRIVQEALNNIIRHSEASKAFIQIIKSKHYLSVSIEDNGKGFKMEEISPGKSIGLKNIENRVIYSNGKMEIETNPGKGTLLMIDFPLKPKK